MNSFIVFVGVWVWCIFVYLNIIDFVSLIFGKCFSINICFVYVSWLVVIYCKVKDNVEFLIEWCVVLVSG